MLTANIIKHNQKQAIQLPQDVAFPEYIKQVEVIVVGNTRILTPVGERWRVWAQQPSRLSDDFLNEREQPETQERESFDEWI